MLTLMRTHIPGNVRMLSVSVTAGMCKPCAARFGGNSAHSWHEGGTTTCRHGYAPVLSIDDRGHADFDVHVRSGTQLRDADTGKDRLMRRHAQAHLLDHQVVRRFIEGKI